MNNYYKIESGDSLNSIAKKFNTTVDEIKDINNINDISDLRVNMQILIPKVDDLYFNIYTVETGDSLYRIAKKYNINPQLLANLNGLNFDDYIYPNQEILIPKGGYSYYITAEGDTLDIVADTFKISKEDLLKQNETIYLLKDQVLVNKRK